MIISFSTHKGGTGKTTSSINLASALARAGNRTLLIDLDPQGHSSIGLGLGLAYEETNIADVLKTRGAPLDDVIRETDVPNLHIAPSNIRLAAEAESLYSTLKREERLQRSLSALKEAYAWTVIDCPPALGVLTANAIVVSDTIIIPCQTEARALDGLGDLLDAIHLLKDERFNDWWILLARIDMRKKLTREIFEENLEAYRSKVLQTQIVVDEALNQAQMAKRDIYTFDPKCRGAQCYEGLTQEIIGLYT
jgi:chromosome partitioning protein